LDEYVQGDDGYYSWEEIGQHEYELVTLYLINMTSQKWQDESFSSRAIWWHVMGVAVPHNIRHYDKGFLAIVGGDNKNPDLSDSFVPNILVAQFANATGTIGGYICQVPNQPTVFSNDPTQDTRSEDSQIAWSWRTYLDMETPDKTVILRMPMTKAAKRGLDTVYEVAKAKEPASHITTFLATGASKRGWTTWSLAVTDQRVVALVPMVFSMLNMFVSLQNHYRDMDGAWSFAFEPYWAENMTSSLYHPRIDGLFDVEDMYRYRERLAGIPKLAMSSSGDEFFILDDNHQWWNDMPGPKWLMMLPNAEHVMAFHYRQIIETLVSFWIAVCDNVPLPEVKWIMQETEQGGLIVIDTIPLPANITAWSATTLSNDTRRDYRLLALDGPNGDSVVHPVRWFEDVNVVYFENGYQYGVAVPQVPGEWVGFFIEATWEGPPPHYYPMVFTTQVNIVPYTWPRGDCLTNEECYAYLI
jgi:PhoPQ-activated pathogenicity-related protein